MSKIDTRPLNARRFPRHPVEDHPRDWAERDMQDAERPNGPVILAVFFLVVFWGVFACALVTYLTGSVTGAVSDVAVEVAR